MTIYECMCVACQAFQSNQQLTELLLVTEKASVQIKPKVHKQNQAAVTAEIKPSDETEQTHSQTH